MSIDVETLENQTMPGDARSELARIEPDPTKVIAEATEGVKNLDQWQTRVEAERFPIERVRKLAKTMTSLSQAEAITWDEVVGKTKTIPISLSTSATFSG